MNVKRARTNLLLVLILSIVISGVIWRSALAQQVAIPTTAAEVPGPPPGTAMTKAYVEMAGRMAYMWGYALVNASNRAASFAKAPTAGLLGGVVPVGYNHLAMLTNYISPSQHFIACPNQDVVYGAGFFDLAKSPAIVQVPDFGDRFWVYALYNARTDEAAEIGKQYGTKPGFYMLVGPSWNGTKPAGVTDIVRSSTDLLFAVPRIFMDDTPQDHTAIQTVLREVNVYPLSEFDGKIKTMDWTKLPHFPVPPSSGSGETKWVNPNTYFDQLGPVMERIRPLPGEEAIYKWIGSLLTAAKANPQVKESLNQAASAADRDMVAPLLQWKYNGVPAGNGWTSSENGAQFGTDYLSRTATSKSNMYENVPRETKYIYTDDDHAGQSLNGNHLYAITFAKGQIPPVHGFWSLTLYDMYHFFYANPLNRFSLGTKNKTLKPNPDGSLTLYAGATSPGADKSSNWLPAPRTHFSLYIRAYWADQAILDGRWKPPTVTRLSQ
jgi:hypothetical protein